MAPGPLLGHRCFSLAVSWVLPAWELLSAEGSCPAQAGPMTVQEGGVKAGPCLDDQPLGPVNAPL